MKVWIKRSGNCCQGKTRMADELLDILHDFVIESQEALDQVEPKLIEMSKNAGLASVDDQIMNSIFRLFHSMKGSAGFLNLTNVQKVTHEVETLLDLIRKGDIQLSKRHVDLLLRASDFIRGLLSKVETHSNDQGSEKEAGEFIEELKGAAEKNLEVGGGDFSPPDSEMNTPDETTGINSSDLPELLITPEMVVNFVKESSELLDKTEQSILKLEKTPEDHNIVEEVFRGIHSFKGNCGFFGFEDMERLSHKTETILENFREKSVICGGKHIKLLLLALDVLRKALLSLSNDGKGDIQGCNNFIKLLDEASPGKIEKRSENSISTDRSRPGPEIAKNKAINQQDIRVNLGKLDTLIELVGELIVSENMVVQNPDLKGHDFKSFEKASQHLHKITRELQEMSMSLRMIPVANAFRKMNRLVHDLTQKSGKEVELEIIGEDTEVDKTVIELIADPLVHMIRNSIDHGLESPSERKKAGKTPEGKVTLEARHESGEVWIIVKDDGRGLDREKILRKGIELGLVNGNSANMTDEEVYELIFEPGFSTADKITDVSGRGVGMDVVRRNIDQIKGQVDIQSTQGKGTKITTRIPLTLAIIDGMLVQVGEATYTIPLQNIKESIRARASQITIVDGDEVVMIRHKLYPVLRLHKLHEIKPNYLKLEEGILVMVEHKGEPFCVFVDKLLGQQQTVIKGLSSYVGNVRGVSGCTILGSGDVSLILDTGTLAQLAKKGGKANTISHRAS